MKHELMELATGDLKVLWRESKQAREYKGPHDAIVFRPRDQEQLIDVLLRRCTKLENENEKLHGIVDRQRSENGLYIAKEERYIKRGTHTLTVSEVCHNGRKKNFSLY